jgi:hypothetical protein
MRRLFPRAGVGLVCLAFLGCIQVPYCIPELSVVPAVKPGCDKDEVHVFRADLTHKVEINTGLHVASEATNIESIELSRLHSAADGSTPQLTALTFASGSRIVGFWNFCHERTSHTVAIRLYRPGFATIELRAGMPARELAWEEATDLETQEKAVDDLLGVSPLAIVEAHTIALQRRLVPADKSGTHRHALLFAAGEYERLARDAEDSASEERLLDKARRLRRMADAK